MDLEIKRPRLLPDEPWAAIMQHHQRLTSAIDHADPQLVIGSAKELAESVARVVIATHGVETAPSAADFSRVVNDAHRALERQAGPGITNAQDVKAIAQHAKKIVLSVKDLRNDFGTGHGHAELRSVASEMVELAVGGALLWVRWALTRLDHLILAAPEALVNTLRGSVTRRGLQEQLEAIVLPEQPEDVQFRLGTAFAHRSAGGTFVARQVGLDAPAQSDNVTAWPKKYRFGIVEGLTLSSTGFVTLDVGWIATAVDVLLPVSPGELKTFLNELAERVVNAKPHPSRSVEEDYKVARAVDLETHRLPAAAQGAWRKFADALDPTLKEQVE